MNFVNETDLQAGWTMGLDKQKHEVLIVAVKATYSIPENGESPELVDEQVPLVDADQFTGEPGYSAPLYESDYALEKPHCDVLLNGSAHAPHGEPTTRVPVTLRVGNMSKSFKVIGERYWERLALRDAIDTPPEPFMEMPISYDNAYGGIDDSDPERIETYVTNPVGCGFYPRDKHFDKLPMPNTEETNNPVRSRKSNYKPMSFGPIGRSWTPRYTYAGTYDEKWLNEKCPFYPDDFELRYFQSAPLDQQIPHPLGGERVELLNLSSKGHVSFHLPQRRMPILILPKRGNAEQRNGVLDTIVLEPDANRFIFTWRVNYPLRRHLFELREVVVDETIKEREEYDEYEKQCRNC